MPGPGVLRLLTSQQRAVGWKRQPEVEKSLGLEKGAISRYFQQLGQSYRAEWAVDARLQLKMAGVYRVRGLRRGKPLPPKNWWIAFAGKGNPRPTLDLSKETHLFSPERAPGEQGGSPACLAELREKGQGSPSTPAPETSEGRTGGSCTAAPDQSEGGRGGTSEGLGERIEGVKGTPLKATPDGVTITCMRSRWLSEPALQAMMSSCTWDYFLTKEQLGRFLCIKEDDLQPILSQVTLSNSGDGTFLRTCGIRSRKFNARHTYCLLGCGNLVTLGPKFCVELLAVEPQPLYWGMLPWGVEANTNVTASLGTIKTMVDLSKAIQASLRCRRCSSGVGARWSFMRRESQARMILSRGAPLELGLNFECDVCGCIHLGESLPDLAVRDFERTSLSNATDVFLRTLPSLYQPEFDRLPKAGVMTAGRISPHGAMGNSSTVTRLLSGSTGNSPAERSNPACPSPKTPPAGTCVTPKAQTRQGESPRSAVSLHRLATATPTLRSTASEGGICLKGSGSEDGLPKAVRRRSLVGAYLGHKGEAAEETARKAKLEALFLTRNSPARDDSEKDGQSKASVEMPLYDRAGSNHRRSEGEATMHLKTTSRRKKARPGAAKASPSSRCQTCKKRGVSSDFLATQQHYKRGKTETCEAVQRAWSAGGSRSSPGTGSETVP